MIKNLKLAIDFDGVIHDFLHPIEGRKMGPPIINTKHHLDLLHSQGHTIIVFSVWGGTTQGRQTIQKFMQYYQLPYNEITNIKPNTDFFIDDRAIHFTTWEDVIKQIQ
jgi:hypothetical protein